MIELKYYKNIHARLSNTNRKVFSLQDACIYYDAEGNRYCYLTLANLTKKYFFALLLHVKQYDATGQMLKEGKFYLPNVYSGKGLYVLDEPFEVEKECDAVDVYVELAEFSSHHFYKDRFVNLKTHINVFAEPVTKKVAAQGTFNFNDAIRPMGSEPVSAPLAKEGTVMAEPIVEEKPAKGKKKASEEEVAAEPVVEEAVELSSKVGQAKIIIMSKLYKYAPIILAVVILVAFFLCYFVCDSIVKPLEKIKKFFGKGVFLMKEDKFILEKPKALDKRTFTSKDHFVVISEDLKFVKVAEFSDVSAKVINADVKKEEEPKLVSEDVSFDEKGQALYYAEEVFDDEDDIYSNEFNDRLIEKSKFKTYPELGALIDEAILSRGFKGKVGLDLLASMTYSHLINLPSDVEDKFIDVIFDIFELPHFAYEISDDVAISDNQCIYNAIKFAKENPDKPTFMYVKGLLAKKTMSFFRQIYYFIDNPVGDSYLTARGKSISVPKNLFILYTLKEDETRFDISRRLLRYNALLNINVDQVPVSDEPVCFHLSCNELYRSLVNASDEYSVSEDGWRKIDTLCNEIGEVNGFVLQNKIVRRLEEYCIIYLSNKEKEEDVLDKAISNNLISEAIITTHPDEFNKEHNLQNCLDTTFGAERTPLTAKVIKEYLSLFGKGGSRSDS